MLCFLQFPPYCQPLNQPNF